MSCTNGTPCFKPILRLVHSERCRAGTDPARLRARVEELEAAGRLITDAAFVSDTQFVCPNAFEPVVRALRRLLNGEGEEQVTDHTTHYDDCGCLTARYEAEIARLRARVEELEGAMRECESDLRRVSSSLQDPTKSMWRRCLADLRCHDRDEHTFMREIVSAMKLLDEICDRARRVLGETGKDGGT